MPIRCVIHLNVLADLLLFLGLAGWPFGASAAVYAQAESFGFPQRTDIEPSAPAGARTPAIGALFRQHCVKCHGEDGTGSPARGKRPEIPNFTDASWQGRYKDAQLLASILDGKEPGMPRWRDKISDEQARGLVAHVRAFAPTAGKSQQEERQGRAGFEERFRRLQEQLDELRREFRKRSQGSPPGVPSKASEAQPSSSRQHTVGPPLASSDAEARAAGKLFRKHCVKCHGEDGTGGTARSRLPEIPNFTDASWQGRRSGAQLLASILDGKGKEMPAWRGKVSAEQARSLVVHVRSFAPTKENSREDESDGPASPFPWSRQEEQEGSAPAEAMDTEPSRAFFEKLIDWLGKFHPPAVHFPIALLTAAAVAELLRMATGNLAFGAASRYCIWFGALTAVGGGLLGWFRGGFRLIDASSILMIHRWLGTSTVTGTVLVLVLSEVSRRVNPGRTLMWFRITLLVVAALALVTGFFGGAMVFGLDHYTWPA